MLVLSHPVYVARHWRTPSRGDIAHPVESAQLRAILVYDRYAQCPPPAWIGRGWESTRKCRCGHYLRGTISDVAPGAVRVSWSECSQEPASWEATDRGVLARK